MAMNDTPDRCKALERCSMMMDMLQGIIEKLKLFPIPLRLDSHKESITKLPNWDITGPFKDCLGLAMTINYISEALDVTTQELPSVQARIFKNAAATFASLQTFVNKTVISLGDLLDKHPCYDGKYIAQFSKSVAKLQKKLDKCRKDLLSMIDHTNVPSVAKTVHHLEQLYKTEERMHFESSDLPEVFVALKKHAIAIARAKAVKALEGEVSQHAPGSSIFSNATIPQTTTERRNAVIDTIMTAPRAKTEPKKTLAEAQGFVSRTVTTRREPNWNVGGTASRDRREVGDPRKLDQSADWPATSARPSTGKSRHDDWPLIRPDLERDLPSTPRTPTREAVHSSPLDDVYDSYHDHFPDAVLGVPGTPVERQPSHRRTLRKSPSRTRLPCTPPPVPPRNDAARQAAASIVQQRQLDQRCESLPATPEKSTATSTPSSSASNYAALPIEEIRDQYY